MSFVYNSLRKVGHALLCGIPLVAGVIPATMQHFLHYRQFFPICRP